MQPLAVASDPSRRLSTEIVKIAIVGCPVVPAMENNELRFTYRGRGVGASVAPRRATRPGRPPWVVTVDGLGTHFGPPCRDGEPEPITIDRIATWLDQRFHDLK